MKYTVALLIKVDRFWIQAAMDLGGAQWPHRVGSLMEDL